MCIACREVFFANVPVQQSGTRHVNLDPELDGGFMPYEAGVHMVLGFRLELEYTAAELDNVGCFVPITAQAMKAGLRVEDQLNASDKVIA